MVRKGGERFYRELLRTPVSVARGYVVAEPFCLRIRPKTDLRKIDAKLHGITFVTSKLERFFVP